jgi:hypothetical protein
LFWKLKRALNLGSERTLRKHIRTIDEFIYGIVAERRKNAAEYADSGDLLSLFLSDAAKRGEELSDKHLRNLVLNFMVVSRPRQTARWGAPLLNRSLILFRPPIESLSHLCLPHLLLRLGLGHFFLFRPAATLPRRH